MKRTALAISLCLVSLAALAAQSPMPLSYPTASVVGKPYCLAATPTVAAGYYITTNGATLVDTSVANTTKITEFDSSGNKYVTTMTTAASGVGSVLTIPACAVH
jgi:hypothetical protein